MQRNSYQDVLAVGAHLLPRSYIPCLRVAPEDRGEFSCDSSSKDDEERDARRKREIPWKEIDYDRSKIEKAEGRLVGDHNYGELR